MGNKQDLLHTDTAEELKTTAFCSVHIVEKSHLPLQEPVVHKG